MNENEIVTICNHCGFDIRIQPPMESECNHLYYPENCTICAVQARELQVVTHYNIGRITTVTKKDKR